MRRSRFSESQIVPVLKEGEAGVPVTEIIRKHGISRNTYFNWKSRYSGAEVSDLKRLLANKVRLPGGTRVVSIVSGGSVDPERVLTLFREEYV